MQVNDRVQGNNVEVKNRKEWGFFAKTLLATSNQWGISGKCPQMSSAGGDLEGCT
jgi:hypothetical protein